ncbi:MAG: shikimate dehydrogenase [Methanomassiliicoccales archaeon]
MRVCVSVMEDSVEEAISSALAAQEEAELVEIRFDRMAHLPEDLSPFQGLEVPIIATLRTAAQGGSFQGDRDRKEFFQKAARVFDHLDLEDDSVLWDDFQGMEGLICSHHDLEGTPSKEGIVRLLEECSTRGMPKAAFLLNDVRDLRALLSAGREFSSQGEFLLMGMGELGKLTRVRSEEIGSAFAYASPSRGKETAEGQLDVATLHRLSGATVTGIVGYPVAHSASPLIHNSAFDYMDIPGIYLPLPTPEGSLGDLAGLLRELDIRGVNVTIPHKRSVMDHLDEVDEKARLVGAVNTVVNRYGYLTGTNTDVDGVEKTFQTMGVDPADREVLVLGAGGAARACCYYLSQEGARIHLLNRTRERAERVAEDFPGVRVLDRESGDYDIIINCTPLGMEGFPDRSPLSPEMFHPGQMVMDTIYNPPMTRFLREAEERGANTCSGIEMLIYQAIAAFEVWTGLSPPYEAMSGPIREGL